MNIDDLNKLEEKVNHMVNQLKGLKEENKKLRSKIEELKKETTLNSEERTQIEQKVVALIDLIDSIERE
jgi:regulator of replication initiation timing